jgi:membrane dipeptidase
MLDRRRFLGTLAVAAGSLPLLGKAAAAAKAPAGSLYARSLVIDAQSAPGEFLPDAPADAALSSKAVADARASGVTACIVNVGQVGNSPLKFEQAVARIASCERDIADHPEVFRSVRTFRDLEALKASGQMGFIYGFQDTSMLAGDLSRLTLFHNLGVMVVQPTYNLRNLAGDGCLETSDGGLSLFGHQFVAEMNRLHMLLDLSHGSARTIADGIAASRSPMAISHTGCRALADVPRNTSDENLRALAQKGGVAGIYFMPFLRTSGQPHAEDVIRHLDHAVNVCGEDHVGLGTDGVISGVTIDDKLRAWQQAFYASRVKDGLAAPGEAADTFDLVPEYNDPRRLETLANDLGRFGWRAGRIEKILGANFARLFKEVWSA